MLKIKKKKMMRKEKRNLLERGVSELIDEKWNKGSET